MEEIGITETPREEAGAPVKAANPLTTTYDELDADDLYVKFKKLQQQLEFLGVQEEYIKDEMQNLKRELVRAKQEVKRIQSVPLVIGQCAQITRRCPTTALFFSRPPAAGRRLCPRAIALA